MDIKDIKDLIITIDSRDIERFELEKGDLKLLIVKDKSAPASPIKGELTLVEEREGTGEEEAEVEDFYIVKSPMVGIFYQASSPDAEPFVKTGSSVEPGQILCIIEAMKVMNEIEAEVKGEIVELMVKNEEEVEYGQALMKIRRF